MATTLYCSLANVQGRLGADGVNYRVDDDPTFIQQVLDDASRFVDEHCLLGYSEANLAASPWVKHRTADVAAYLFCERRGNAVPAGIAQKFERAEKKLERVRLGKLQIPDVPARRDLAPVMDNVRIRMDPFPRTVVEKNRSTKRNQPTDYAQHNDSLDWFDYQI